MHNMTTVLIGPIGVAFFLVVASDGGTFGGFGAQSPQHLVMAMATKCFLPAPGDAEPFFFSDCGDDNKICLSLLALAYDLCINVGN